MAQVDTLELEALERARRSSTRESAEMDRPRKSARGSRDGLLDRRTPRDEEGVHNIWGAPTVEDVADRPSLHLTRGFSKNYGDSYVLRREYHGSRRRRGRDVEKPRRRVRGRDVESPR